MATESSFFCFEWIYTGLWDSIHVSETQRRKMILSMRRISDAGRQTRGELYYEDQQSQVKFAEPKDLERNTVLETGFFGENGDDEV